MHSEFLPLFPLKLIPFPGEVLQLHIFEPRYKQLVKDCLLQESNFGIPVYRNNKISDFGTEMEIISIEREYPNGELDIKTKGKRVIQILNYELQSPNKLYPGGDVTFLKDNSYSDPILHKEIKEQLIQLYTLLKVKKRFEKINTFTIAHHIGLSTEQEFTLLQISNEHERQQMIFDHLKKLVIAVSEAEKLKDKVKLNGHFKNLAALDLDINP